MDADLFGAEDKSRPRLHEVVRRYSTVGRSLQIILVGSSSLTDEILEVTGRLQSQAAVPPQPTGRLVGAQPSERVEHCKDLGGLRPRRGSYCYYTDLRTTCTTKSEADRRG